MRIYSRNIFVVVLLLLPLFTMAQRGNQTLLWRISGKGMQRPSYLFGSMHLTDKRLFRFDDSVYAAIEHTEGFANEVDMNEIAAYFVNKSLDGAEDKKIKDVMSADELKKYEKPLAQKFNKPVNDITTKDITREKNKWVSDFFNKGEMPTFVDAYLYDIARRQGKWLGGIEDLEDQTSMMDGGEITALMEGEQPTSVEQMIEMYTNQDIDGINRLINGYNVAYRDMLLTRRNLKMARRMDSLAMLRPMFFAIGAAHLPGDSGVIRLLRQRGFTVEPVFSKNKIFAKNYTVKEVPPVWHEEADQQKLYKVSMPGIPATVKIYGLVEMKFMLEFSNLSGFCSMAIVMPGNDNNREDIYDKLAQRIFKRDDTKPVRKLEQDGLQGVEYIEDQDGYKMRAQFFYKDNVVYVTWVYGKKEAYLETPDAERFFTSLKVTPHPVDMGSTYTFTDSLVGITFTSPVKMELNETLTKQNKVNEWDIACCSAQDQATGAYILLLAKQAKAGNYISNDSIVLADLINYFKQSYTISEQQETTIDGYKAMKVSGRSDNSYMKLVMFVRGNKNILLILITDKEKSDPRLEQVFSSLRIIPYEHTAVHNAYGGGHTFSSTVSDAFRIKPSTSTNAETYFYSFDTVSATNYNVSIDTLSRYTWATSDSAFARKKVDKYLYVHDSLIYRRVTVNGTDTGYEEFMKNAYTNIFFRERILIHGNLQYNLSTSGEYAVLVSPNCDKFFADFRVLPPITFDIHRSKAAQLFADMLSKDSATCAEATNAVKNASFEKNDLPALHKAMLLRYPNPAGSYDSTNANRLIGDAIIALKDPSSLQFVKENYASLTGNREKIKYPALVILSAMQTKESYEAIADLLLQAPPKQGYYRVLAGNMKDSLPLLKTVYPSFTKLITDTTSGPMVAEFAMTLYDSGFITLDDIRRNEKDYITLADKIVDGYVNLNQYDYGVYHMMRLLAKINTPAAEHSLKQYLAVKNIYLKTRVALLLAINGYKVDEAVLDTIAANPSTRSLLYKELKEANKEYVFPESYLTQKYFSESAMADVITDDEDAPPYTIVAAGERTKEVQGVSYKFYLYKVTYTGETDTVSYLGVAGAYNMAGSLTPEVNITGIYSQDQYDATRLDALFEMFIENSLKNSEEQK